MLLNKAPSEPRLGCANTHIWAAGRSELAELPHSWPAAPDLRDKGSFGPVGAPRSPQLARVQCLPSPLRGAALSLWLSPVIFTRLGTLPLTAFPAQGMPFPSLGGQCPARTGSMEQRLQEEGNWRSGHSSVCAAARSEPHPRVSLRRRKTQIKESRRAMVSKRQTLTPCEAPGSGPGAVHNANCNPSRETP